MRVVGSIEPAELVKVAGVSRLASLEELVRSNAAVIDVIVQDEYTHDVVAICNGVVIVLDTT
jgi:hypothetical protein